MKKYNFFAALTAAAVAICSVAAFPSADFAAAQQEGVAEGNPVSGTETYCIDDKVRWQVGGRDVDNSAHTTNDSRYLCPLYDPKNPLNPEEEPP